MKNKQWFHQQLHYLKEGSKTVFSFKDNLKELGALTTKEYGLLVLMLLATIISSVLSGGLGTTMGIITLICSIATALNLILIDRGFITNYLWGILAALVWLIIAFENRLFGDIASQLYYFVMQFIGIIEWQKSKTQRQSDFVESKSINKTMAAIMIVVTIAVYLFIVYTSYQLGGNQVWLDAALLPLALVAQLLMTYGYKSQWIVWIIINALNVIIWSIQLAQTDSSSTVSMLVLQVVMLVNSLYGAYVWYKQAQ
ncbi:nicotinamide riboside transporter PnuC [Holzapfeliella sp. JNUCC 80]